MIPLAHQTIPCGSASATAGATVSRERPPLWPVLILGGALLGSGTSSSEPIRVWAAPYVREQNTTTGGERPKKAAAAVGPALHEQQREATGKAVSELRRLSGLTWEHLAQLFGVTRRSVHFWASGKPLNAENEAHLLQALDVIRFADRGDAHSNRSALLTVHDRVSALDLLAQKRFDDARARLGAGPGRRRMVLGELSPEGKAARAPLPPEVLIDALQDRVHPSSGRLLASKPVKLHRRK